MTLNTLKYNHLIPLVLKGLTETDVLKDAMSAFPVILIVTLTSDLQNVLILLYMINICDKFHQNFRNN